MIDDMQYPATPYAFDIETSMGDLRIEMESTEFDAPTRFKIITYGGNVAPEAVLKRYFHEFGFGMQGHRIDLEGDQALPSDIYHVLTMSRTHLQEGKQGSVLDFQALGFIPPDGYADLLSDPDDGGSAVLESAAIDAAAHEAAASPKNDLPEPTEAQKEAGNYRKGHVTINGLDIAIENPAGSERSGVDRDGKKWTSRMNHHYGYIKGTRGRDKDHLDVFLGPDPENADKVFIVNQTNPDSAAFDEHKIMMGFPSEDEARAAYLSNHEEGWQGLGSICTLFIDEFKDWLANGDTTIPVERGAVGSYRQDPSWVGVDLDGTLARYDGWVGEDHIGEPVPLMMAFVKHLIEAGRTVKIFTARASDPAKIEPVKEWLEKYGLGALEVTNVKDHNMTMLYDDRAAKVIANTGVIIEKARESAIMERGQGENFRDAVQGALSFGDIENVFADTFGPIVVKRFIFGEISDLENQIRAMRERLAQVAPETDGTGITRGEKTTAYLNDNSPIELQYAVIEADRLSTSHTDEMGLNKDFSQDLQPRDRAREGMKFQVEQMAGKLNPERLGESTSVSTGAPIIGQDLTVESGNGRTIAIRKAYTMGDKGQEYKQWLVASAGQFGISARSIEEMERPILVRIRLTEIDRAEFARKANEDEIAQMAPSELARADAAKLTDDDVALFQPSEDGSIAAVANRAFITRFFEKMGANASTGYMTKDGGYTKQLVDRVQAAIFQKAYQDDNMLALMAEEADPKIKNILGAMTIAAGEFSRAKAVDASLMGIDIPRHVIEAANLIKKSREDNQAIEEALAQGGLFEDISEDTRQITLFIDKNIRSARRMGSVLKEAARILRKVLIDEKEPKLMETRDALPTPAQIVAIAIEKEKATREGGGSLFEVAGDFDWRKAIEEAKDFEEIMAVFQRTFPMGAVQAIQSTKQPWEMTRAEYRKTPGVLSDAQAYAQHYTEVRQALAEGRPVPVEVVNEYREMIQGKVAPPDMDLKAGDKFTVNGSVPLIEMELVEADPYKRFNKAKIVAVVESHPEGKDKEIADYFLGRESGGLITLVDADKKYLRPIQLPVGNSKALVMRAVRDFGGNFIGRISEPYDGTEEGMLRAAQRVEERMWLEYPDASGINSVTGATGVDGNPKWAISPNLKHVAELGTDQARYIWGDINAFKGKRKNLNLHKGEITHDS